jgi:cysteine sulfinate desulfinase/cysteine desulfurase-like protein
METIKAEYKTFLKEVAATYPKATTSVMEQPSSMHELTVKTRDFNEKAKNKLEELIAKNPQFHATDIRFALAPIQAQALGDVVTGHL